jgi:cysteinyl-tRNA synthetase
VTRPRSPGYETSTVSSDLRLYDSLRRQKVTFEPLQPGKVSMYLCGPTTYTPAHIGHAYSAICFDTIRRSLQFLGYEVRYVRNVTDVDDKIIKRAAELGVEPLALSAKFSDEYNRDMRRFGVLPPDVEPRVSTHIPQIIAITERLIEVGKAYAVAGDVYFDVDSFPEYGRLSGQTIDELRAGARVDVDERKRAPADFALWKAAKPGEIWWDSPWGKGRPGWHIECSAMTTAHLGLTFDIHAGGKDLIFPHHENEIAQSQGAYGTDTFARYWMHNGFLNFEGIKMSRSLGNVFGCAEIADAVGPEALRFFCVSHSYRSPVDFEVESMRAGGDPEGEITGVQYRSLEAADRRLDYFYVTLRRIDDFLAGGGEAPDLDGEVTAEARGLIETARAALADDFNTPVVVAAMGDSAKAANKLLDEGKGVNKVVRRRSLARLAHDLRAVGAALGVLQSSPREFLVERRTRLTASRGIDAAEVERLLADRIAARAAKDYTRADEIRARLQAMAVEVHDTPTGADWKVLED